MIRRIGGSVDSAAEDRDRAARLKDAAAAVVKNALRVNMGIVS